MTLLSSQKDSLPEQVRAVIDQQEMAGAQQKTRQLHKTVSAQAAAQKELQKIRSMRSQYLTAWGTYLGQLESLLEQQMADQAQQLEAMDQQELQWAASLQSATATLAKLTAGETKDGDSEEQAMDEEDTKIDAAVAMEQDLSRKRAAQQETGASLLEALKKAKQGADEEAENGAEVAAGGRQASRTPRRGSKQEQSMSSEEVKTDKSATPATPPFIGPISTTHPGKAHSIAHGS
ncbi:unnamed protein product [Symbiodinium sp. CCMP2592]|nr:unnamed protein product [Symbiodinium sp. CCMP2592]